METSQLICCANQLTDFYMRATLALNGLMFQQTMVKNASTHSPFPKNASVSKLFNCNNFKVSNHNNVKVTYSSLPNFKSVIKGYNKNIK